jgi:hypothetical protein
MSIPSLVLAALAAGCATILAAPAVAQRIPEGTTVPSGGLTVYHQFSSDLDRGGDVGTTGVLANLDVLHQFTRSFAAGVTVRYGYENWDFGDAPGAFVASPWGDVHRPGVGLVLTYAPDDEWRFLAAPTVQWSYERGASTGDALTGGALLAATRRFSPGLSLGLGVGVFDDLEETQAFPFVLVDWRINERWRLGNPFRAGPAGGAGLEIAYTASDAWEIAAGGTWRKYRFRLDRDGPYPGGIGESRGIPLFLRTSYALSRDARLDFLAGVVVGGKLTVMDPDGNDVAQDDYDAAPLLGITLRTRF